MAKKGVIRFGKAKRVKLELPADQQHRLREPIAAECNTVNGQLRAVFYHDPSSKYNWGEPSEQYGTVGVEIPCGAATFHDEEAKAIECTYMQPEKVEFLTDRVVVLMPKILVPPRKVSRYSKQQPTVAAEEPLPAGQAPLPVPTEAPRPAGSPNLYQLVHALNSELQQGGRQVELALRNGRVVITEVCQ